ncbi:MAG: helix-turn-helix domain-containing protein [Proteobacteria bacterium]|nr:helix-turn-helix domain-containing protein [Pseudomonadota bacterium]
MADHDRVKGRRRAELAKRTGCNLETIRYYEKIGLMPDPPRTAAGYRTYDAGHEHRLRFILRARELGFGIEEIRGLLALVDGAAFTCAEVREMTLHHLAEVRAKIADLRRLEHTLATTVAACSGDQVPDCPVIDALVGGVSLGVV